MKETVNQRKLQWIKKVAITFVMPLFLLVIGMSLFFVAVWDEVGPLVDYGTLFFTQPEVHIVQTSFKINDREIIRPEMGDLFGQMRIERIGVDAPIYQGDSSNELRLGIGHFMGSLMPGEGGNVVLAGHRETVFWPLEQIEIGDEVIVETSYGIYTYEVEEIYITEPSDVTPTTPTNEERLTFYTCYPFIKYGPTPERFIVVAKFISVV